MHRDAASLLLTVVLAASVSAAVVPCVDYADNPELVGWVETLNAGLQVQGEGDRAYLLEGNALSVHDISDPTKPSSLAGPLYVYNMRSFEVREQVVYAACSDGFRIFDFSDPEAFVVLAHLPLPGQVGQVGLLGDLVAVASRDSLFLVDADDLTSPQVLGSTPVDDWVRDIARDGTTLGVVTDGSLRLIDISDPAAPSLLGLLPFGQYDHTSSLLFLGPYVLVGMYGSWQDDLVLVDRADPAALFVVAELTLEGYPRGMEMVGDLLYVGSEWAGVEVVDLSEPTQPRRLGTIAIADPAPSVRGFDLHDGLALVADYDPGLSIVAPCTGEIPPHVVGHVEMPSVVYGVAVSGDLGLAVDWMGSFWSFALDAAPDQDPLGLLDLDGTCRDLTLIDDLALVAGGEAGLHAVSIAEPASPTLLATAALGSAVRTVAATTGLVAGGLQDGRLQLVALGTSPPLTVLGDVALPASPVALAWSGAHVVCALGPAGIAIVDAADPTLPTLRGALAVPGGASDVVSFGSLAYVAAGDGGLHVVDLVDPDDPMVIGSVALPASAVDRADQLLYSWDGEAVTVLDLLDPTAPMVIGRLPVAGSPARDLAAGLAGVLVASSAGASVLTPQCPDGPVAVELGDLRAGLHQDGRVHVTWAHASSAPATAFRLEAGTGTDGPWYPAIEKTGTARYEALDPHGAAVGGHLGYRVWMDVDGEWTLLGSTAVVLETPPKRASLGAVMPNPFNPTTAITFTLAEAAAVRVTVHDLRGRELAELLSARHDAGVHRLNWDGRDGAGRDLPSGTYLVRLEAGGSVQSVKAMLVR